MADRGAVSAYLEGVSREAADRPRALAAGILAGALRRASDGGSPAQPAMQWVEEQVGVVGASDPATAAEVVYEIGSLLVELRERFPNHPGLPDLLQG